ncbi:hypothetical protein KP509_06G036800 [Ceratopteris richardii]|uniref:RING-CH-type domain-containing protein n=1 Tax=Ceratopteris richardii TaxID=49495 RepID=A0A8T2UJW8_CERRI|nr:hypothetical protein KP509_06G036800 [Ceratopteris richardii]
MADANLISATGTGEDSVVDNKATSKENGYGRPSRGDLVTDNSRIDHDIEAGYDEETTPASSHSGMLRGHLHDFILNGHTAFEQHATETRCSLGSNQEQGTDTECKVNNKSALKLAEGTHALDEDLEKGAEPSNAEQKLDDQGIWKGEYCRVCQLTVEAAELIQLGCACKDDLALAHRHCAETWFKIKGNWVCEICGSTAQNVVWNEGFNTGGSSGAQVNNYSPSHAERFWQNQPFCNTVLFCVLLILIASWLFRIILL